jgi:hypothetical protein
MPSSKPISLSLTSEKTTCFYSESGCGANVLNLWTSVFILVIFSGTTFSSEKEANLSFLSTLVRLFLNS